MLFNSPLYGVFLLGTFVVFWLLRQHRLPRRCFCSSARATASTSTGRGTRRASSRCRSARSGGALLCLGIIFVGSTLDFWIGRALGARSGRAARKALLLVRSSTTWASSRLQVLELRRRLVRRRSSPRPASTFTPTHLRLVLPFGISFFTFETMSYTIDVYRRSSPPAKRYLDYLLFVCFFPHLVAGPIVRPRQMLPQLARDRRPTRRLQARGLWLIATGLAKKIAIGDYSRRRPRGPRVRQPRALLVARGARSPSTPTPSRSTATSPATPTSRSAARSSSATSCPRTSTRRTRRRTCRISGGAGTSRSPRWLRDYLYIPLGGTRGGSVAATYRNLMLTMVLGGLWHGASWNFVDLGRAPRRRARGDARCGSGRGGERARARASDASCSRSSSTFHFVCFAWIFFRAPTLRARLARRAARRAR